MASGAVLTVLVEVSVVLGSSKDEDLLVFVKDGALRFAGEAMDANGENECVVIEEFSEESLKDANFGGIGERIHKEKAILVKRLQLVAIECKILLSFVELAFGLYSNSIHIFKQRILFMFMVLNFLRFVLIKCI